MHVDRDEFGRRKTLRGWEDLKRVCPEGRFHQMSFVTPKGPSRTTVEVERYADRCEDLSQMMCTKREV